MVFICMVFGLAIIIVFFVNSLNLLVFPDSKLSIAQFIKFVKHSINYKKYHNSLYILGFLFCIWVGTTLSILGGLCGLFFLTFTQKHVWSLWLARRFLATPQAIRPEIKEFFLQVKRIFRPSNIREILTVFVKSIYDGVKQAVHDNIEDIKRIFTVSKPKIVMTKAQQEFYDYYRKIFPFRELHDMFPSIYSKTDEEVRVLHENFKKFTDLNNPFNIFRGWPMRQPEKHEENPLVRYASAHLIVFYNFFKTTLVAVFFMVSYFLYTIFFFKIQFLKQLAVWFVIGMLYFWLMSGFNFFLKRYQYGKFTSQIQRFWKRTNTYFWLIEGFLLLLFFYYYLNSSQEPLYMYDYSALNQEYLVPLHSIGINIILLSIVIYFMYFIMLRINSNSWTQLNLYLMVVSTFIFFSFFIETYQFYYVISVFNERVWIFNEEENLWVVDIDSPILRTKHHYLLVCLIAKYWHFLFIFLSWVFFLIKSFERKKITFVLFGANLQNMVILYVLNFACYIQWFKWIYRRFFDLPYTWFYINIDNKFTFRFVFELKLLLLNLLNFNVNYYIYSTVVYKSLNLWNVDSLCMWKFI